MCGRHRRGFEVATTELSSTEATADIDWRVRDDRVHTSLYLDPAIFEAEFEHIWNRTWVWVAHESEIAKPGDFKSTFVGRQPVLVTRDESGEIHVMLNRCRHRAAAVCETERGNASSFTCPYHGWTYELNGRLKVVPFSDGYSDCLDKAEFPLARLRVGVYRGLVFASANPDGGSLEEHLGGARAWIDAFMDHQGAGYPLRVAGQHRFDYRGNWKIQLENTTDFYHFPLVHGSFIASVQGSAATALRALPTKPTAYCRSLGNGHSVAVSTPDAGEKGRLIPASVDALVKSLTQQVGEEVAGRIVRSIGGSGFNLNLFPNLALSGTFLRELRPIAVDRSEVRHIALAMDGAPTEANRFRLRIHEQFQGQGGFGTPDDVEVWERVQRGARAGKDLWILLNRGLNRERETSPGERTAHLTDETGMREAYSMWKRMMTA